MKKFSLLLTAVLFVGCCNAPTEDVVDSIEVLRDNTHRLSQRYKDLLMQSKPAEGQDPEHWKKSVQRDTMLMKANNKLADKVLEWAKKASGNEGAEQ